MTHRFYTFSNYVLLLLVLNVIKMTNFFIVCFPLMTLMVCNSNRVPAIKKDSCTLA